MVDVDHLCEAYLNHLYPRVILNHQVNSVSETYGEILPMSVDKLLARLSLNENDVFYDLGSGLGKLAIQVFLKSHVGQVIGIEIVPALHAKSVNAAYQLQRELPGFYEQDRVLAFRCGSFLELPLTGATVVLIASPCFSPDMMRTLESVIEASESIHTVLTLRPMHGLKRLQFKKAIQVQCSWDSALCYFYW